MKLKSCARQKASIIIAFAFSLAAEIERNLISQRTEEALAAKKLMGIKLGRPNGSSPKRQTFEKNQPIIATMIQNGESISSVARQFGMHRNTLRRFLNEAESGI